jgi:hypothetical protein
MNYLNIIFFLIILNGTTLLCYAQDTTAAKNNKTENFTLLTAGLSDMQERNAKDVVAERWSIKFKSVAGCMVTKELRDSMYRNNIIVTKNIEDKYGKSWRNKFEKEVKIEFEKQKIVTQILDTVSFIQKKDKEMNLEGNGLHYRMKPIGNTKEYTVSVNGWGEINGKDVWVSYYKMTVNYKKKTAKLISNSIEQAL